MDPQKLSQLDPKLRDAYQRVMGTPIPTPSTTPVQTPPSDDSTPTPVEPTIPTPEPTPAPQPEPIPTPEPQQPEINPTTPPSTQPEPFFKPQPVTDPNTQSIPTQDAAATQPAQPSNFVQMNSEVPAGSSQNFMSPPIAQAQAVAVKKKGGLTPILFAIVGLVFLVIYTLFWTKIFNFKLPFLP